MATFQEKVMISAKVGGIFALVSLPQVYGVTNRIIPGLYDTGRNCPTYKGLLLHTLVFFVLTYLSMTGYPKPAGLKAKYSFYSSLIYFFLASPTMYQLTGQLFGRQIAVNGCPTMMGIMLHSLVYVAALTGVMYFPDRMCE